MDSYRPNVAAIFTRSDGKILICERLDTPNAWQFPQGGIDKGENPEEALKREIEEETGFTPDQYTILTQKGSYKYDYPSDVLAKKKLKHPEYIGQQQDYFLCKLSDDSLIPRLEQDHPEFSQYKWIHPNEFQLSWLPDFKKQTYSQVFLDFFQVTLS